MGQNIIPISTTNYGPSFQIPDWALDNISHSKHYTPKTKVDMPAFNEDIMNFSGKWMEPENIILSEVIETQKGMHGTYSLIKVDIRQKL